MLRCGRSTNNSSDTSEGSRFSDEISNLSGDRLAGRPGPHPPGCFRECQVCVQSGKDAEARQNYEQAYDFYKRAYDLKPKDLAYRAAYERLRFLAGASHVHRGQLLRSAGKLEEALAEFNKALEIDPASSIAQQEARQTQRMIDAAKTGTPRSQGSPPGSSLMRRLENAPGPVELTAISPPRSR